MRSLLALSIVCASALGALEPSAIPRSPTKHYVTEGVFEGGKAPRANLEGLRVATHVDFERWVVDFSDVKKRQSGAAAPRFQIRYVKSEGEKKPARFVLTLRGIAQQFVQRSALSRLVKQSQYVDDVVIYPPIEDGDLAVELKLKGDVAFDVHQPIEREGRLVLDLKPAPPPVSIP